MKYNAKLGNSSISDATLSDLTAWLQLQSISYKLDESKLPTPKKKVTRLPWDGKIKLTISLVIASETEDIDDDELDITETETKETK